MNGSGEERYSSDFERKSKKLKLLYHCAVCGETDYKKKECHHKDGDKKNSSINNLIVLCINCHKSVHAGKISLPKVEYEFTSKTVKNETSLYLEQWINKKSKVELKQIPASVANQFRKQHVKGWIKIGRCNIYIGMIIDGILSGVLGFTVPEFGNYDMLLKADTTPQNKQYSTELLLYLLKTEQTQRILEIKTNREIKTVYSMCFSKHKDISRYRKHGQLVKSVKSKDGYNIGYLFELGKYKTIKEAFSLFLQKHKEL